MSAEYILAHDLGTTGNKASLYDSQGKVLASSFYGYGTEYPAVNCVEQNPEDWWKAVCVTTKEILIEAHVPPEAIAGISFSGQMMGCVAVDREVRPLRNAIIWADQRGIGEAKILIEKIGM
ncbi:MAG TPA: FGGY family carbohydrate kinase, partial [Candidatus Binatia bacterium]|nr:FGGY family carbohydrate kinase [Candidatus Binatia bacterium]